MLYTESLVHSVQRNMVDRQRQHSTNSQRKNWCQKKYKKQILNQQRTMMGWHNIGFEGTEILTEEKNYWRRFIIEGMEIKKLGENRANRQIGYEIDECWSHNRKAKVVNANVLWVFPKNRFIVWSMKIQNENALQRHWYSLECFLNLIYFSVENSWRRLPIGSRNIR